MFSGIDWICGGAEEFTAGALRNPQQCRRRNPQQCRTGATWDGYRRNNYTDCLLLSLSQMGICSLAHFFILMYGQAKSLQAIASSVTCPIPASNLLVSKRPHFRS